MTLYITDKAEEFRIEISGQFVGAAVADAATAWKAALLTNVPRRISVDMTRMTGFDHGGYLLLRDMHAHGTHMVAGTAKSLKFLQQISSRMNPMPTSLVDGDGRSSLLEPQPGPAPASAPAKDFRKSKNHSGDRASAIQSRAMASGE